MDSAEVCRFLAVSFLFLTLLRDATASCDCQDMDLYGAFCGSDFVVRAKFLRSIEDHVTDDEKPVVWLRYDIKVIELLKFPKWLTNFHFIFTALSEDLCGYVHKSPFNEGDYLVTGKMDSGVITINSCSYIRPWADLTEDELRHVQFVYPLLCLQA